MSSNSNTQNVSSEELRRAWGGWVSFTKSATISVVSVIAVLIIMALALL